jgi:hypothetical protein
MFEERKKGMTNEQEKKLEKMNDQKLLCELAVAYGNTAGISLDSDKRSSIMRIFDALDLSHMRYYPCESKEGGGS